MSKQQSSDQGSTQKGSQTTTTTQAPKPETTIKDVASETLGMTKPGEKSKK